MLGLKNTILLTLAVALISILSASWLTFDYTSSKYEAKISKQKEEAATVLAAATADVLKYERDLAKVKDQLEVTHDNNQKAIDSLAADNRKLIIAAGGLRDPGRRQGSNCAVPSTAKPSAVTTTSADSSRLSNEAQDFLFAFATDADRVVEQYESCQRWAAAIESNRHVEGPTVIKQAELTDNPQRSYDQLAAHSEFYLIAHIFP